MQTKGEKLQNKGQAMVYGLSFISEKTRIYVRQRKVIITAVCPNDNSTLWCFKFYYILNQLSTKVSQTINLWFHDTKCSLKLAERKEKCSNNH